MYKPEKKLRNQSASRRNKIKKKKGNYDSKKK